MNSASTLGVEGTRWGRPPTMTHAISFNLVNKYFFKKINIEIFLHFCPAGGFSLPKAQCWPWSAPLEEAPPPSSSTTAGTDTPFTSARWSRPSWAPSSPTAPSPSSAPRWRRWSLGWGLPCWFSLVWSFWTGKYLFNFFRLPLSCLYWTILLVIKWTLPSGTTTWTTPAAPSWSTVCAGSGGCSLREYLRGKTTSLRQQDGVLHSSQYYISIKKEGSPWKNSYSWGFNWSMKHVEGNVRATPCRGSVSMSMTGCCMVTPTSCGSRQSLPWLWPPGQSSPPS